MTSVRCVAVALSIAVFGCIPDWIGGENEPAEVATARTGRGDPGGYRATRPTPRLPDLPEVAQSDELLLDDEPHDPDELFGEPTDDDPSAYDPDGGEPPEEPMDPVLQGEGDPYVPTTADQRLLAQALGFFGDFLSAIEGNAGACDRMADAIDRVFAQHHQLLLESKRMQHDAPRDRWFTAQAERRIMPMMERLMGPLQGCIANDRVIAALRRVDD